MRDQLFVKWHVCETDVSESGCKEIHQENKQRLQARNCIAGVSSPFEQRSRWSATERVRIIHEITIRNMGLKGHSKRGVSAIGQCFADFVKSLFIDQFAEGTTHSLLSCLQNKLHFQAGCTKREAYKRKRENKQAPRRLLMDEVRRYSTAAPCLCALKLKWQYRIQRHDGHCRRCTSFALAADWKRL